MASLESVAVLTNRTLLDWQVKALERVVSETGVDVPLVVMNETTDIDHPGFSEGASPLGAEAYENAQGINFSDFKLFYQVVKTEGAWAFVLAERKLSWLLGISSPGLMQRRHIDEVDILRDAERLSCRPIPIEGQWCDLPGDIVDQVATETDVVIRFGFNLLTGKILSEPNFGVLSFHPGDIREYRGLSPARMFLNNVDTAGSTLQQLTDTLDGGNIVQIETTEVGDINTLDELEHRINELQIRMLASGIERLQDPDFDPHPSDSKAAYVSVKKRKSPLFAGRVLAKNLRGRLRTLHQSKRS